ncbi:MAG: zinc ABC transporter substrate-binding protein, partial [Rickettsiales bacterium]|nr:zinc ABC transporter substrate-binding protein [Rickettsiales bacterium]
RDALIELDRPHSARYKENAELYTRELRELDSWVRAQLEAVPEDQRVIITTHDAFRYFGQAYGVRLLSAAGVSTDSTPSAADLAELVDQMRTEQIHAVFLENVIDDKFMKQLQKDADAVLGGTLYSDSLSPAGGPATNYISLMKHNVNAMTTGMRQNGITSPNKPDMPPADDTLVISIP